MRGSELAYIHTTRTYNQQKPARTQKLVSVSVVKVHPGQGILTNGR